MRKSKSTVVLKKIPYNYFSEKPKTNEDKYKNIFAEKQREKLSKI